MSMEGAEHQQHTACCSGLKGKAKLWEVVIPKEAKEMAVF